MSSLGALIAVKAGIPPKPRSDEYLKHRERLAIFNHRAEILEKIRSNKFTLIKGSTGSGKTTQVPQYILEDSCDSGEPVRIIACIPRRVGVVAVCDRVTEERGEKIGHTVGYTIRLESCASPCETLLTFCTAPILVSALSSPGFKLETTTHIILDEVHARDRYTDFLLACFRDVADLYPNMKFVFLGENMHLDFLQGYFEDVGKFDQVLVHGRDHHVQVFYEDQILELLKKSNNFELHRKASAVSHHRARPRQNNYKFNKFQIDKLIEHAFKDFNYDVSLAQFMHLVKSGQVAVDYQHSRTSLTMLMAVASTGRTDTIKELLEAGANLLTKSSNGYTALDWARSLSQFEALRLLEWSLCSFRGKRCFPEHKCLNVNLNLIKDLIHMIYYWDNTGGSILIFLPTYDDMVLLKEMLCSSGDPQMGSEFFIVYFLHPHIQTGDHRAAFEKPKPGVRKIILSTSIGESCLTFDDVVFVIDSGINREYCYDSVSGLSVMKQCWISKSAANQRKDRAGKTVPGICYRLYSENCFQREMVNVAVVEMCRAPLSLLCLQTRAVGYDISIAEFFASVPTPPSVDVVQNAVETLMSLGALDRNEELTDLGIHLLDYSIEPSLSKAIIYSVVFRCMDPILTLAAVISYGDPFTNQMDPKLQALAHDCKVKLSGETFSDHMALLKAFQTWEEIKSYRDGDAENYCKKNYLSSPAFEIIYSIRSRLLGQLRASGFVRNKGVGDVKYLNCNSDNWAVVKAVLTGAFYPNICRVNPETKLLFNKRFDRTRFDDTSVLSTVKTDWYTQLPSPWVIFEDMVQDQRVLKGCTLVNSTSVALLAGNEIVWLQNLTPALNAHNNRVIFGPSCEGNIQKQVQRSMYCVRIDNWMTVLSLDINLDEVVSLRHKIKDAVLLRLRRPGAFPTKDDQLAIATVARILATEDSKIGLKAANVGQWPKLVSGNLMSTPRSGFEIIHEQH